MIPSEVGEVVLLLLGVDVATPFPLPPLEPDDFTPQEFPPYVQTTRAGSRCSKRAVLRQDEHEGVPASHLTFLASAEESRTQQRVKTEKTSEKLDAKELTAAGTSSTFRQRVDRVGHAAVGSFLESHIFLKLRRRVECWKARN